MTSKAYRVWDLSKQQVVISRDIICDEFDMMASTSIDIFESSTFLFDKYNAVVPVQNLQAQIPQAEVTNQEVLLPQQDYQVDIQHVPCQHDQGDSAVGTPTTCPVKTNFLLHNMHILPKFLTYHQYLKLILMLFDLTMWSSGTMYAR